ncbi:hypothetical protein [Variovorax sp. PBL-E5]|uniref:hypothetical protein n=1 Tax=Variovorax sp. PBL-E5 TaxID=434014 RepID=UPI0013A59214|nr:hypothetical protein [Variovorax sp. PBL-E5]
MNDELPTGAEFEAMTIARAREGDAAAGKAALQICVAGLYANHLSEPMRFYLAQCLIDVADDMKADRAMNVEVERHRGRPKDPFPEWQEPLAAFGALLKQRGYIEARIEEAMDAARQAATGKALDLRDARRIREKYQPMDQLDEALLIHLCGDQGIRGEIAQYPPVSRDG